ncbi:MAG: tryptophan synthase subunit alpha, partial [Nitrososphaera sp.]|nr:tryptophan synthase subunit alpha [Nitrososphaera sp.]
ICYIVAGYPDLKTSQRIVEALIEGGADIIEIGIPFSDPIADGPTIQAASNHALDKGIRPEDALRIVAQTRKNHPLTPILGMTYSNILLRTGVEKFMTLSKGRGIDGFIIPDLPYEEADRYLRAASKLELSTVFLAAPNTPPDRLDKILQTTSGFLYLVSVFGITGARKSFAEYTRDAVRTAKLAAGSRIPVAVGFGISTPSHVRYMIQAGADAVIVGSAIIDRVARSVNNKQKMLLSLKNYAQSMKKACQK